jgi:hypothetical protein
MVDDELQVELFDARHLASGFGSLDAFSHQHDPVVDTKKNDLSRDSTNPTSYTHQVKSRTEYLTQGGAGRSGEFQSLAQPG